MRWRTTIAITTLTLLLILAPFFPRANDETFQSSEERQRITSKPAKLYHGMNKKYRPGDEPDMQINITVKLKTLIGCKESSEHWIIKNKYERPQEVEEELSQRRSLVKTTCKKYFSKKCWPPSVKHLFKVWPRTKNPPEVV